jgi:bifunctional DNA-binding transcriptional regulator/antitoxin component of YhaV-PrlF toxin-antitoxin module
MNVVKVTTSGQITIPIHLRRKLKTQMFFCDLTDEGLLFRPIEIQKTHQKKPKYTLEDFKKWKIKKSKCPTEHNLAQNIDKIIYTF